MRLGRLLAELGSAVPGGIKTTDVMRLHLPDLLAKPLQQLVQLNPQARVLGDLFTTPAPRARCHLNPHRKVAWGPVSFDRGVS